MANAIIHDAVKKALVNAALRHETARAVLAMTAPDVTLIPEAIVQWVRWPNGQRPLLARFFYEVRRNWGWLLNQAKVIMQPSSLFSITAAIG